MMDMIPLALPDDNQSFSFLIPPNVSEYILNFSTNLPKNNTHYRWVSDITYRVDGSGIYNIDVVQVLEYRISGGGSPISITINPGFYGLTELNTVLSAVLTIPLVGENSHKAVMKPTITNVIVPPLLQKILQWPATPSPDFVPSSVVDIMINKDLILVYASCVKQSQVNNKTNLCAIPITDFENITIGEYHSKTPLLPSIDTVDSIIIRLRDIDDVPYTINSAIFLNLKMLFCKKTPNKVIQF